MSQVAADFQSQASSAIVAKASRQSSAPQKTPTSRFDDLLSSIPDAPPEPRARAKADAPERPQPAETRGPQRDERTVRNDRPARPDRSAKSDIATDSKTPPADTTPAKNAAVSEADTGTSATKAAGSAETTAPAGTEGKSADTETADAASVTQAAVAALVPTAAAVDPGPAPVAALTIDGEAAIKPDAAKAETPAVAPPPSTEGAKQQAAMLADQTNGLSADDAEVLSALAAKAQQGLKSVDGDKSDKKTHGDKTVHAAKLNGDAAATGQTSQPAEADGAEAKNTEAKPVQSDLAKLSTEHQRNQAGDNHTKAGAEAAPTAGHGNAAAAKAPDGFAAHLLSPSGLPAQAVGASAAADRTAPSASSDKPVAVANVPVEISAKIASGKNQFDIRLDPEELGKIHVKVNVDRDGNVTTHMVADRRDTLDLLRRDTQGLERALQDAGLKTSDNSLQFSLRDQAQQQQPNQRDGQASQRPADEDELATTLTTTVIARDYGRYSLRPSGVDIRV